MPVIKRLQEETVEERQARRQINLTTIGIINDATPGNRRVRRARQLVWAKFEEYCHDVQKNAAQIFIDFCSNDQSAKQYCLGFLSDLVTQSKRLIAVPTPNEYEERPMMTSATTLLLLWNMLVAEANETVLAKKREIETDPRHKLIWTLVFNPYAKKGAGPAWEVRNAIINDLAQRHNLTLTQIFDKVSFTADDILEFLRTLWKRAGDIPCRSLQRMSMHFAILLEGIAGFRPEIVMDTKYEQVEIMIVRHPADPTRRAMAVTLSLEQNKQRTAPRTDQSNKIKLSMVVTSHPLVCLTRLVVSRALEDDAFDTPFASMRELLERPLLEPGINAVRLRWKAGKLNQKIFPIGYQTFLTIWHRTTLVMGYRNPPRPYAMRVGTGHQLDRAALSPCLRGYIMSNSDSVYHKSYQAPLIAEDLTQLAFGDFAGKDAQLFRVLNNSSIDADPRAPIYISEKDLNEIEQRRDVRDAREYCKDPDEKRKMEKSIEYLVKTLTEKKLKLVRDEYFVNADTLRSMGLSAESLETPPRPRAERPAESAAQAIAITHFEAVVSTLPERDPYPFSDALVAFLRNNFKSDALSLPDHVENPSSSKNLGAENHSAIDFQCLLCDTKLSKRDKLTRHTCNMHIARGAFDAAFDCPRCLESGHKCQIHSPSEWANHTESCHGRQFSPFLPSAKFDGLGRVICLLCLRHYVPARESAKHIKWHMERGDFKTSFCCPECLRLRLLAPRINGVAEWMAHARAKHPEGSQHRPSRTMCHACHQRFAPSGYESHMDSHEEKSGYPLLCLSCTDDGKIVQPGDRRAWYMHVFKEHTVPPLGPNQLEYLQRELYPTGKQDELQEIGHDKELSQVKLSRSTDSTPGPR